MDTQGEKLVTGDFTPQARLAQHLKDVGSIQQLADRANAALPLSEVHRRLLERAVQLGYEGADNSAIVTAFEAYDR